MPTCLFERYADEMDALEAEWLLDLATANDYAGWGKASREKWWHAQERRIRRAPKLAAGPSRRTSLFFWGGVAIGPDALKSQLAGSLGYGLHR